MLNSFHRWLGVALAGWLVLAGVSGILLLWEDEYYDWRYPEFGAVDASSTPDPEVIASIVGRSAGELTLLGMPRRGVNAYHAYFADGTEGFFHARTGALVDRWGALDALPAFLFELHAHLFMHDVGMTVAGALGIAACLNAGAGFLLWLRRRGLFRFRYAVPKDLSRGRLIRGHAAQGALLQPLLLTMLLSGVAMAFSQQTYAVLNAVLGASGPQRPDAHRVSANAGDVDWTRSLAAVAHAFPDGAVRFLTIPLAPGDPLVARVRNRGELHPNGRSYAVVHTGSGEVLQRIDATQSGWGPAVGNAIYPVHAAKTGWPGHRLLFALLSLSLLYIAVSGAYLALSRPTGMRSGFKKAMPG